jgi:hypothetical protein
MAIKKSPLARKNHVKFAATSSLRALQELAS